ncbi:MAG: hypothetical protein ACNA7Z_06890 [Dethiobacteria bacterium]
MQKKKWYSTVRVFTLGVAVASLLLAVGCAGDGNGDDGQQSRAEIERDSLLRVLADCNRSLVELEAAKEDLDEEVETLTGRTESLSATAASRAAQLRIVSEEKAEALTALEQEMEKSAALEEDIKMLREQIESLKHEVSVLEQEKMVLESQIAAEGEQMKADSVAIAGLETSLETVSAQIWRPHYVNNTELTLGFGLADTEPDFTRSIFGVTNVFGYAFTERLTGGIGTGAYFYNGGTLVPLYFDFRYRFRGTHYKPFIVATGGMLFNFYDFDSSGAFINPSFGIERRLNQRAALHISVGPQMQHAHGSYRASFIVVRAGVNFNRRE